MITPSKSFCSAKELCCAAVTPLKMLRLLTDETCVIVYPTTAQQMQSALTHYSE